MNIHTKYKKSLKKIKEFKSVSERELRDYMRKLYEETGSYDEESDTFYDYIIGNVAGHIRKIKEKLDTDKSLNRDDVIYFQYELNLTKGILNYYYAKYKLYKYNQLQQ